MNKAALSLLLIVASASAVFAKYIPKGGKRIPQTLSRGAFTPSAPSLPRSLARPNRCPLCGQVGGIS